MEENVISYWRQQDIFMPDHKTKVTIIGAGGIGSWVCLGLLKTGFKQIEVWDGDVIEAHNIPNQDFNIEEVSRNKAFALASRNKLITPVELYWNGETLNADIIVIAVDNMETRKQIVETQRASLIIDGRIGGEIVKVVSVSMVDFESKQFYLDSWYPSADAAELPCAAQNIADIGFFVGGFICNRIRKFLKDGTIIREVLFDANTLDMLKIDKE